MLDAALDLTPAELALLPPAAQAELARLTAEETDALARAETLATFIARVAPKHVPIPWHLEQLIALFERAMREQTFAVISLPPRHAKTTTVRRALAYAIKKYPDRLNALGMYAEKAAAHNSRQVRKMVRAEGVALEPDAQQVGLWLTREEGGLFAAGAFGQWTGKGIGGLLVLDDILKGREAAESETIRDKIWETFTDDIFTRLEPPVGSCIIVTTRWHEDDVPGRLARHADEDPDFPRFEVINLPALRDPRTGAPSDAADALALWPERFPREKLVPKRAVLGPYGWGALFQGDPRPRGGKVFERDPARYVTPAIDGARIVLFVDGAGTEGTSSDFTAAVAQAVRGSGAATRTDVLEVWQDRLIPEKSAPELLAFQKRWGDGELHIEDTRDGRAIARALWLIEPALRITLVPAIGDKFTRAQPIAAAWNQGRARVPLHAPWLKPFLAQAGKFRGVGSTKDDMIDALSGGFNVAMALDTGDLLEPPEPEDTSRWAGHAGAGDDDDAPARGF